MKKPLKKDIKLTRQTARAQELAKAKARVQAQKDKLRALKPTPKAKKPNPGYRPAAVRPKGAASLLPKPGAKGKLEGRPVAVPSKGGPITSVDEQAMLGEFQKGTFKKHELLADLPELFRAERVLTEKVRQGEQADRQRKSLRLDIEGLFIASDIPASETFEDGTPVSEGVRVTIGQWGIKRIIKRSAKQLSVDLLLKAGVTAETIAACYVPGAEYSMLDIRPLAAGALLAEQDAVDPELVNGASATDAGVKILTA